MGIRRTLWQLRRRLLGPERVVTGEDVGLLTRSDQLSPPARRRIRVLHARELMLGVPREARLPVAGGLVELGGGDDFPVDWKAFVEIFGFREYAAEYRDAHVLDVGAHKGYFGAFALACGAAVVLSFEPATRNYGALERAARPARPRWLTRNAAVGATAGTATLHLDETPWAHSLREVERPAGEEQVRVVTLEQALAELPTGGARTIAKIDAEGSECDILARPGALARVDALLVEWHEEVAPCSLAELTRAITATGLWASPESTGLLRFTRDR
jgi:FkbM family methyltransferase